MSVASEYKQQLSELDERLVTVLTNEDIRLLRVEWLLAQREDYKIQRRQELEELERADQGLSPFFTGEEAADLMRNGAREVGALSYGWLLPWDPDPTGERLRLLQRILKQRPGIKAIFWDQATLYQPPREEWEQAAFDRALDVMMDLYASAIGTTVLQIKDIPHRPVEYDGLLCLGGIQKGTDEKTITAALQRFGEIEHCMPPDQSTSLYRVKFKDHSAAEEAIHRAPEVHGLYDYAFVAYKSVPYDEIDSGGEGRGWCICESALAGELVARLRASPKIRDAVTSLPPKMLCLAADEDPLEIKPEAVALADRVSMVTSRLKKGTFTSVSDHEMVTKLYVDYVKRIVSQLQATLALTSTEDTQLTLPAIPCVSEPVADLVKLVDGQLLLQLSDAASRRAGGEGASLLSAEQGGLQPYKLLVAIEPNNMELRLLQQAVNRINEGEEENEKGRLLKEVEVLRKEQKNLEKERGVILGEYHATGGCGDAGLLLDSCSQVVLPWRPLAEGWAAPFLLKVKQNNEELTRLLPQAVNEIDAELELKEALQQRVKEIDGELKEGEENDEKFQELPKGDIEGETVQLEIEQATKQLVLSKKLLLKEQENLENERGVILEEYRATGGGGERRYGAGQWLTVRQPDGQWTDAQVSTDGAPPRLADGQELALHPWNHAPRELVKGDYEMLHEWWMETLRVEHSHIADALTGKRLDVLKQCVAINMDDAKEVESATPSPGTCGEGVALSTSLAQEVESATPSPGTGGEGVALSTSLASSVLKAPRLLHRGGRKRHTISTEPAGSLVRPPEVPPSSCPLNDAEEWDTVQDARTLAMLLHAYHSDRCKGGAVDMIAAALLTGPPAAGKTSLMSQVIVYSLESEMVPILIKVQQLQGRLIDEPDNFGTAWNWVDAFLHLKYHDQPAVYHFLRQALLSRRALLLLDGLDEGGAKRGEIQRHVTEVLAPQGHVMLCSSRPAGLTESSFPGFRRLYLSPLTEQQQHEALKQRLGATAIPPLLKYLRRLPVGDDGQRVTSNPLMLSMIASVYELRQGVGMPETIAELYEHASEAMLSRGGASSKELRRLMQTVFFEAHAAQRREIEDWHLDEAALSLELPEVLADIRAKGKAENGHAMSEACAQLPSLLCETLKQMRERVANDKLPLFSLLEAEPLKLQSSHLSFQEYFAARMLCEEGTHLSGEPPWQWSAWWQNALKLGEMMDGFGSGMLRAAGVQGDTLSLSHKLGGDRATVLMALCIMLKGSQIVKLKLANNQLCGVNLEGKGTYTVDGITTLCEALKGSAVTSLDLDGNSLTHLIPLRGRIERRPSFGRSGPEDALTDYGAQVGRSGPKARLTHYSNDMSALIKLVEILPQTKIKSLSLACNQLCGLNSHGNGTYTTECITKLCQGLKGSAVTSLNLQGNDLGPKGGATLAEGLKGNSKLQSLESAALRSNQLDPNLANNKLCGLDTHGRGTYTTEGITKLCEGLKGTSVTSLRLANNQLCGVTAWEIGTYTTEGITKLCEALKGSAVTSLNLNWNSVGVEGASTLAAILKEMQITTLGLANNVLCGIDSEGKGTFTVDGIATLCEALKGSAVTSLDLSWNRIEATGAMALAAVLKDTKITTLDVDGHPLQIDELKGTKPTEEIDLSNQSLHVASAIIIASCIK